MASLPISLLTLPAELLTSILSYVFDDNLPPKSRAHTGLPWREGRSVTIVSPTYSAAALLAPLLTCKQFYLAGHIEAFKCTHFLVANLYIDVPSRLSRLSKKQLSALRTIALVVDARHFRAMRAWDGYAFNNSALSHLDTLTIALHQTTHHYLFDFTADIAKLLRRLQGVRRVVFVRNQAYVKGSFKTWCNRLVGSIMKIDHYERYDVQPPNPERTWWEWGYDVRAEAFCLDARPSKETVDEETYMQQIKPLIEELMIEIEKEEWNPDPRTRNGT